MAKGFKTCRVCGKVYECCHTNKRQTDGFRWQDVACSPECGEKYLADILASRGIVQEANKETVQEEDVKVEEPAVAIEDAAGAASDAAEIAPVKKSRKKASKE